MVDRGRPETREKKLENLITNHSMIFMGLFEEGLSAIAESIAQSSPGGHADLGTKATGLIAPDVLTQIGLVISEIREEMASQMPGNASAFAQYVSSRVFDRGIEIVEKFDFGRPKLTEKLTDEVLASYVFLLQSGDKELGRMFAELKDWQRGLPKPPWAY